MGTLEKYLRGCGSFADEEGAHQLSPEQIFRWHRRHGVSRTFRTSNELLEIADERLILGVLHYIAREIDTHRKEAMDNTEAVRARKKSLFDNWLFFEQIKHGPLPLVVKKEMQRHRWYPNLTTHKKHGIQSQDNASVIKCYLRLNARKRQKSEVIAAYESWRLRKRKQP